VTRLPVSATPTSRSWDRVTGVVTRASTTTDYRNSPSLIPPQGNHLAAQQRRSRRSKVRSSLAWKEYDRSVSEVFSTLKLAAAAPLRPVLESPPSTVRAVHCPSTKDARRPNNCAISATTGYPCSPAISPPTLAVPQFLAVPTSWVVPTSLAVLPSLVCLLPHRQNSVTEGGFSGHWPFYRPMSPVTSPTKNSHFLSGGSLLTWSAVSIVVCVCTRRFGWTAYLWCFVDSCFDVEGVRHLRFLGVSQTGIGF
jgi:hypothetical protein